MTEQTPRLDPAAYAPYRDPEDYILSWTDKIWESGGMGLIRDHYAQQLDLHGAYGTVRGVETVIRGSLMKKSAFPHRSFTGEDVVWEQRGSSSWISSHRTLNTGSQQGYWQYGPPTFRDSMSRNIAVCLVRDALIVEEWVARDEWAVVEQSGLDVGAVARSLAFSGNAQLLGEREGPLFDDPPTSPLTCGESGPRVVAPSVAASGQDGRVAAMIDEIWNQHLGNLVPDYFDRDLIIHSTRYRSKTRADGYKEELDHLFAPFPDAQVEIRDIAANHDDFRGQRVSVLWVLRGSYCGVPLYGPVTNSPVEILGISHFAMRGDRIYREWRVYDELAVLAQISRARGDEPGMSPSPEHARA